MNAERNELQRKLLEKCIAENLLAEDDLERMMEIFKLVSDIIDNPQEEHESIRAAFESHDFDHAAEMLFNIVKDSLVEKE